MWERAFQFPSIERASASRRPVACPTRQVALEGYNRELSQDDLILFGKAWTGRVSRLFHILENVSQVAFPETPHHSRPARSRHTAFLACCACGESLGDKDRLHVVVASGGKFLITNLVIYGAILGHKLDSGGRGSESYNAILSASSAAVHPDHHAKSALRTVGKC